MRSLRGWPACPGLLLVAALLAAPVAALEVEIGVNFTAGDLYQSGFIPPDSQLAVGEDHLVELLNGRYAVYRKSDGLLVESSSLYEFWTNAGVPVFDPFDPRILYDARVRRWFAVSAEFPYHVLVAVSHTADPTQGWSGFAILTDSSGSVWTDFPMLGLDDDSLQVTANMFTFADTFAAASALVIPKADLVSPTPTVANATIFERISQLGFTPQPVVDLDGTGASGILLSDFSLFGFVVRTDVVGDPYAPALVGPTLLPVQPFGPPPPAPQPGPKPGLETGQVLAQFESAPVLRGGSIWAVGNVDAGGRAALRWLEIDADTNQILQTGVLTHPELALYYGSIAVNEHGHVVIGCSGSSETQFVSSYAVVGETQGGVTTFGEPILLKAGVADYEIGFPRNRWGDYSATVVDPSDSRVFWTIQEFVLAEDVWATQITELRLVDEIEVAIDVKPGSATNPVNLRSRGVLPVALLGSASFLVADVDASTLVFGPSAASPSGDPAFEDVNADGFVDLVLHFRTLETGIAVGDTQACLIGATLGGRDFRGCDAVRVVRASCGLGFEIAFALGPLVWLGARRARGARAARSAA